MTTQNEDSNVTLLVSNQSFDINPIDIEISIDEHVVVQDEFDVQGDRPPQHNWQQYHLCLDDGPHSLVAKSEKGQAQLHTMLEVAGAYTVTIAYWYDRRSAGSKPNGFFTLESGSVQIGTM